MAAARTGVDRGVVSAVVAYVLVAGSWLLLGRRIEDGIAGLLGTSAATAATLSGTACLVVTAGVLWWVLARWRRVESAQDESLHRLLEDAPEGIYRFRLRPERGYEYVNRALCELTGFGPADFRGNPDLALERVHPDDRHRVAELRERPGELTAGVEVRWQHPDGHWVWHWVREVAATDASGRVTVVHGAVTDVTEFKRQTATLRAEVEGQSDTLEALRKLQELRDSFLRSVSHEIRTPLTGILGFSRMLADLDLSDEEELRVDATDRLIRSTERLQQLIDDLLDLDQVTAFETELDREPVDVPTLVDHVVAMVVGHDAVSLEVAPGAATVDRRKVERILTHLLHNAVRHTPAGTAVHVCATVEAETLLLVVADEGPGVPDELKDAILAPFAQGPEARTHANPGIGVGLAVVDRYARMHGGTVTVGDRPGGGARFEVRLPTCDDPAR